MTSSVFIDITLWCTRIYTCVKFWGSVPISYVYNFVNCYLATKCERTIINSSTFARMQCRRMCEARLGVQLRLDWQGHLQIQSGTKTRFYTPVWDSSNRTSKLNKVNLTSRKFNKECKYMQNYLIQYNNKYYVFFFLIKLNSPLI